MIKTIMTRWFGNVAHMGVKKISRKFKLQNPKGEDHSGDRHR
jgi:hypothetical protein